MIKCKIIKNAILSLATLITIIILSLLLLSLVASIPRDVIRNNLTSTIKSIHDEGNYPFAHSPFLILDNYTDCVMCNIVLSADSCSMAEKVLLNPIHVFGVSKHIERTNLWAQGKYWSSDIRHYGRYWHGYQIPLTLLLLVTDYKGIRVFNGTLYFLLLFFTLWLLWRRLNWKLPTAFLLSLLIVAAPIVAPLSMQYFGCHIIMLASTTTILLRKKHIYDSIHNDFTIFLTIGAITAFFDLLTTPIITLGVPLACYIVYQNPEKKYKPLLVLSLAWAIGYIAMWSSKWLIATSITGENVIANALNTAQYRTIGNGSYLNVLKSGYLNLCFLLNKYHVTTSFIIGALILITLFIIGLRVTLHSWKPFRQQAWWLAIGTIPIIWYCLLLQHSLTHFFFTWRTLLVTIFALIALVLYSIINNENETK